MYVPKDWSKISNEELVEALRYAAAAGYDNREERDDIQKEILRRLSSRGRVDFKENPQGHEVRGLEPRRPDYCP